MPLCKHCSAPKAALPEREQAARAAGVVAALVVGDQRAIERSDWALFRTTGVAHLMSISGLHITLFAWLAMHAVGALWRRMHAGACAGPPHAALVGGCLLACGYALFSGWGLPAQRTVLMLATSPCCACWGCAGRGNRCGCWPRWWWCWPIRGRCGRLGFGSVLWQWGC